MNHNDIFWLLFLHKLSQGPGDICWQFIPWSKFKRLLRDSLLWRRIPANQNPYLRVTEEGWNTKDLWLLKDGSLPILCLLKVSSFICSTVLGERMESYLFLKKISCFCTEKVLYKTPWSWSRNFFMPPGSIPLDLWFKIFYTWIKLQNGFLYAYLNYSARAENANLLTSKANLFFVFVRSSSFIQKQLL